ncbi:hypothetical protein MSG28_007308 [Choristoneura fumiferana]|uniref:Uncharacterized protein n=1 Tax=Choristoneura fumiferana TaxID=7141 RepID=A0ACC0JWG2_CHOFU|nr:hypothetical protein MSG28_007308 [Choristoneura fumiferana]
MWGGPEYWGHIYFVSPRRAHGHLPGPVRCIYIPGAPPAAKYEYIRLPAPLAETNGCGKGKSDVFWVYYVSAVTDALAAATATHRCYCDLAPRAAPLRLVSGALSFRGSDELLSQSGVTVMAPAAPHHADNNNQDSAAKKVKLEQNVGKPSRVIHIRNIPNETTEAEIIQLGLPFGRVTNVLVLKGKNQDAKVVILVDIK